MMDELYNQAMGSLNNQFLSGGLALGAIGGMVVYLRQLPKQLWTLFLRYATVTTDVQSDDQAYDWLLYWLYQHNYGRSTRRTTMKHIRLKDGKWQVAFIPSRGSHWFFHKRRPVWLTRQEDDKPIGNTTGAPTSWSQQMMPRESISLRLFGRSRDILTDLLDEAKTIYMAVDEAELKLFSYEWGEWTKTRKTKRLLSSVFLPEQAKGLKEELQKFVDSEAWYRYLGIPYRRGYLFYGPPGTGKSVTAQALASELGMPIYMLNLSTVGGDSGLERAIKGLNHDRTAMVLIEDIDTITLKRKKDKEQTITLGTLLNVLDGVQAADNVVLVMTSNDPKVLDKALLRSGRVDRQVLFGNATEDQIKQATRRFLGFSPTEEQMEAVAKWRRPLPMSTVQENLKRMAVGTLDEPGYGFGV